MRFLIIYANLEVTFIYDDRVFSRMNLTKALNIGLPYAKQICNGELPLYVTTSYYFSEDRIGIYAVSEKGACKEENLHCKVIGSARISDCIKVDSEKTLQMIAELTSHEYANKFPKNLLPFPKPINKNHYIWLFEDPVLWKKPVDVKVKESAGQLWTDIDVKDEFKEASNTKGEEAQIDFEVKSSRANNI